MERDGRDGPVARSCASRQSRAGAARAFDELLWLKRKVHVEAHRREIPEDVRRRIQRETVGKDSCRDMHAGELRRVLAALRAHDRGPSTGSGQGLTPIGSVVQDVMQRAATFVRPGITPAQPMGSRASGSRSPLSHGRARTGRDERQPNEPVTIEQTRKIDHLFTDLELGGHIVTQTWRLAFCRRTVGQSWPQTRADGNKIIQALTAMRDRGWRPGSSRRDAQDCEKGETGQSRESRATRRRT